MEQNNTNVLCLKEVKTMKASLITSETAFYRNILIQRRKTQRQRSTVVMIVCVALQMLWLLIGGTLPLRNILSLDTYLLLSPFIFGLLTVIFALFGFRSFRRASKPVTLNEVAHLRQTERIRLFQQAQGILPTIYLPWRIALDVLIGLLFAASGIACLLFSVPDSGLLKYIYAFSLHGTALYLLYSSLYIKPRRAKHLPAESAQELRRRLALGEEMNGSETRDAHETM